MGKLFIHKRLQSNLQGSRALMREVLCVQIPNLIDQAEKNLKMVRYYTLEGVQYLKFSR